MGRVLLFSSALVLLYPLFGVVIIKLSGGDLAALLLIAFLAMGLGIEIARRLCGRWPAKLGLSVALIVIIFLEAVVVAGLMSEDIVWP